jgi:hypothetical protein
MRRLGRFFVRPLVLGCVALALVAGSVVTVAWRNPAPAAPAARGPAASDLGPVDHDLMKPPLWARPTTPPAPKPVVKAAAVPKPAPPKPKPKPKPKVPTPSVLAFKALGTWVDLYDYAALSPETAAADMHAHGVRTLYIQTARWDKPDPAASAAFQDPAMIERWVHAAHASSMRIVGWYLPAYDDMARDVARTVAIATYKTSKGQRFDALAIDIEYKGQMDSLSAWNAALLEHVRLVRAAVGTLYPIGAIVPAPLAMEVRPESWTGFPWKGLVTYANVFLPMAYWSYRDDCPSVPEHCPWGYAKGNIDKVRSLTGKPNVGVHVIGGVGDAVTADEVDQFVNGAKAGAAYGGSLYDYRTTQSAFWGPLKTFNV